MVSQGLGVTLALSCLLLRGEGHAVGKATNTMATRKQRGSRENYAPSSPYKHQLRVPPWKK